MLSGGKGYDEKIDVWSLGILFYVMVRGAPPFEGETDFEVAATIQEQLSNGQGAVDFSPAEVWSPLAGVKDLISKMLVQSSKDRASAKMVVDDPYLKREDSQPPSPRKVSPAAPKSEQTQDPSKGTAEDSPKRAGKISFQ